jgi:hypothetical protein
MRSTIDNVSYSNGFSNDCTLKVILSPNCEATYPYEAFPFACVLSSIGLRLAFGVVCAETK